MGAHEDLLEAAKRLTARGKTPFSQLDLIAEARSLGSSYPESTLRTFIAGPMCVNSPDHHAVQYGDFFRVSHGLYRLSGPGDSTDVARSPVPRTAPVIATEPVAAHDEWFWEGNVQAAVVRHLAVEGWHIRRVANTANREQGIDIEADRAGERILVEVKGYPSQTYSRGDRVGEVNETAQPAQARAYFSHALLSGVLMRNDHPDARVVLVFPAMETYRALSARSAAPLARAGIELWLADEAGAVVAVGGDR